MRATSSPILDELKRAQRKLFKAHVKLVESLRNNEIHTDREKFRELDNTISEVLTSIEIVIGVNERGGY